MQTSSNPKLLSRAVVMVGAVVALVGCASSRSRAPTTADIERQNPYPVRMLVAPSRNATLFPSEDPTAAAVATFNSHVPVLVLGPSEQGRIAVQVEGDMPMKGFIPDSDLVARAQRSGYVAGTPVYVAANDLLRIAIVREDGNAMVRVDPQHLLAFDDTPAVIVRSFSPNHPGFTGTYPLDRLGAGLVADAQHVNPPGTPARIVRPTPLFSSRDGAPYDERALDRGVTCRVLGVQGEHAEVLVGIGPYVHGFVPATAIEPAAETQQTIAGNRPPFEHPLVALVTPGEQQGELVEVPAGAVVSLAGGLRTVLTGPAYARVLARTGDGADVLVTVTGEIVARGHLPADAIGATATPPRDAARVATR